MATDTQNPSVVVAHQLRRKTIEAPKHGRRTVAVKVGTNDNEAIFDIHEDIITRHSDFFRAALDGRSKEAGDRSVSLPEEKSEIFELFFHFLYTGCLFYEISDDDILKHGVVVESVEWDRLAKAWHMGEALQSASFKDAITDAIIMTAREEGCYPLDFHESMYPGSQSSSGVRKLLVDFAVWDWRDDEIRKYCQDPKSHEFLLDVATALSKKTLEGLKGDEPYMQDSTCLYHEHDSEGKPCYKTMF